MTNNYSSKILFVDLSSGSTNEEQLPEKECRDFIGGQGLGVRILYEYMKIDTDSLGPESTLGFVTGPLTGYGIHGDRFQVVGKSPMTGGWCDSNCGGSFGRELKAAGFDAVFFTGISPKPVYLFLHNGKHEIKDANYLWGKDTVETEDMIRNELDDKRVKIACIGPAGENKSLSAAIIHEGGAAARGGLAAVMGTKLLKALVVRGDYKIQVANPENLRALHKNYLQSVKETEHPFAKVMKTWGTCCLSSPMVTAAEAPIKNWQLFGEESFRDHGKVNADEVTKYQTKKHGCYGCPIVCKGWIDIKKDKYQVVKGSKPEYESIAMLGPNCLISDMEAIAKANDMCNRYGLDTISTGSAIALAMECYERGVINDKDTDGIELTWGNASSMIAMVEKIAHREGFGAVLADGSKIAAERIGKGSEKWSMHIGGQDIPAHDGRACLAYNWGYLCDPTPGRHTISFQMMTWESGLPYSPYDEIQFTKTDALDIKSNASIYALFSDYYQLLNAAGLCVMSTLWPDTTPLVEFISAVTGWDFSLSEGLRAGRRIQTLRQAFNIREGIQTSKWKLPERIEAVPSTGPTAGRSVDYQAMKEYGYKALGWEISTGKPLQSTLEQLGIKELVEGGIKHEVG